MTMSETTAASQSAPAALTLTLFGPMQVLVDGRPLPHLRSRKALWLLALLVLRAGRPLEREWLAGTLWPDADPSPAARNLRVVLSELRHALSGEGGRLQSPNRHALAFDLAGVSADVSLFDTALALQEPEALRQAVALYQGPLLEGCTEEWIPQERAIREQGYLQALQRLADAALAAGDSLTAGDYYRRAVSLDAWREDAQRGLMQALVQAGDANAALEVYQTFVRALRNDDPRAVPDAATITLNSQIRAASRRRASRPAGVVTEEATVPVVSGYLPHPLTELVGREEEREEVAALLRRFRMITLTGPGGIGKTRLAVAVAGEAAPEYPDGAWLVALETLDRGDQVLAQVAGVLGVNEEPGRTLLAGLTGHLRAKRMLLVLDNCEHLLEDAAQMTQHLLRECAGLRVLATSREVLRITGEVAWGVPGLVVPDPKHLPSSQVTLLRVLPEYDGIQLFVERAQAAQKTFALTAENARAVALVCARLEGIPLAIELAAAWVRVLTIEQIVTRLDDHLALLTSVSRSALARQQTLRATLDWSYHLLDDAEKLLLGRLSVFAGGWSLEAAEQVCSDAGSTKGQILRLRTLSLLTSLVDKSLVMFVQRNDELGGRYGLLETVRQYAAEKLSSVETLSRSGTVDQVKASHRDWYLALAEEAEPYLQGAEQGSWRRRLQAEHDNLRAALEWSSEFSPEAESGLRMAGALTSFWALRGEFSEGRKYLQLALARQDAQTATAARAKALFGTAKLAYTQGEIILAKALYEESLKVFREMGDKKGSAELLTKLGSLAQSQGDYAAARAAHEESLRVFKELGERRGVAEALGHLGNVVRQQSNYASSRDLLAESLRLYRELGDLSNIARTLFNLGNVIRLQGEYMAAEVLYRESLSICRDLGSKLESATALSGLGAIACIQLDYAASRALHEECLSIRRELGNKQGIAWSVNNLGLVVQHQGDFALAKLLHQEGLTLFSELEDKMGSAWSLNHLGLVAQHQGDCASAQKRQEESLSLFQALADTEGVAASLKELGVVLAAQGSIPKATCLWGAAHSLRERIGAPLPADEQEAYDRQIGQARLVLGEETFTAIWEKGLALTWEQAATYALEEITGIGPDSFEAALQFSTSH